MTDPRNVLGQVGSAVGWQLVFPDLELRFGHDTHYAGIDLTLPGDLSGGACSIEIEAMNTADFGRLARARFPESQHGERPLVKAELTLFWRDRVGNVPNRSDAPVTAVLAVTGLARRAEGTRLKTGIECQDYLYASLARARVAEAARASGPLAALEQVLRGAGLGSDAFVLHPARDEGSEEPVDLATGEPVLQVLERLGERLAERSGRRGRGVYLLRGGVLHAGAERPIPFAEAAGGSAEPFVLNSDHGLIKAENQGSRTLSAAERRREVETEVAITARDAILLTLTGRADLKPGDVVITPVDNAEKALFGGFGLPTPGPGHSAQTDVQLYIHSVQHRLGKNQGWTTTAMGVTVVCGTPAGVWDMAAPDQSDSNRGGGGDLDAADPAEATARQLRSAARDELLRRARTRVGEVRANHHSTEMDGTAVRTAAQSLDVLVGLAGPDGINRRARRQDMHRAGLARTSVPYLTPFAWGPYGLVLPQYPGSRVLVGFHEDNSDDPVVLGSFWRTADASEASVPQNTESGDWWLILPAGVSAAARQLASGTDPAPPPEDAKAVHDLIAADGSRVIQLKELTIRTLPESDLGTPQTRPSGAAEGGVLITHNNGARIHIASDGAITIEATQDLLLKAGGDVRIEGANIQLKGGSVDVQS